MKMFFLITKLLSASFIFLCVAPNKSYRTEKQTYSDTVKRVLKKLVITISDGDATTGRLTMKIINGKDGHQVSADHGQTIQWLLHPNDNVSEIIAIGQKDIGNNFEIFSEEPMPVGGSKNWEGTISPDTDNPYEWYKIIWKDKNGVPRTDDPLIQVNPKID